uniref:calcium permeable stress-gated cation channel 1-like n=1 Tax=Myxine glutinosa TaxID=7769 RepID=UPI00358DF5FC
MASMGKTIFEAYNYRGRMLDRGATSGPPMLANESADCYETRSESTVLQGLPLGGVHVVLIINLVSAVFLILLFSLLRRAAWNYGRVALVSERDSLTSLFYSETERDGSLSEGSFSDDEISNKGTFSWLRNIFKISSEEYRARCGSDALYYLSFQQHTLALLCTLGVLSLAVLLPLNISGNLDGNAQSFGRTTIANLPPSDKYLWFHTTFSLLYFLLTFLWMKRHMRILKAEKDNVVRKTLFITGLPRDVTNCDLIMEHFRVAYPSYILTDVKLCYDVRRLIKLDELKRKAMQGRLYCMAQAKKTGRPLTLRVRAQGCLGVFDIFGICRKVDGITYYSELEEELTDECEVEKQNILQKPLGMAFVSFQDEHMAERVLRDYKGCCCRRKARGSNSSVLKDWRWFVSQAPDPQNIKWENLSMHGCLWWTRFSAINVCLVLLIFFLTTPAIIVNTMDKFNVTQTVDDLNNPIISQFFPTFLLWLFSALLPFIVYYSTFFEGHWTRSCEGEAMMHKTYTFLVFMVLILPSLGLSSLDLFFRWLFDNVLQKGSLRFECVFLPDNGAFFVNYVITAAFIGTSLALLRLPDLFYFALEMCLARSAAERHEVRRHQAYEFPYGVEYAWMICIVTVTIAYSVVCPVIIPFGTIYVALKHLVDRYNLYYAYTTERMEPSVHVTAVRQLLIAPLLCMLWLLFFSVLRLGYQQPPTMFILVSLVVCSLAFIVWTFCRCCHTLSPRHENCQQSCEEVIERSSHGLCSTPVFVAGVLREPMLTLTPVPSPSHQSYGSMTPSSPTERSLANADEPGKPLPNRLSA